MKEQYKNKMVDSDGVSRKFMQRVGMVKEDCSLSTEQLLKIFINYTEELKKYTSRVCHYCKRIEECYERRNSI